MRILLASVPEAIAAALSAHHVAIETESELLQRLRNEHFDLVIVASEKIAGRVRECGAPVIVVTNAGDVAARVRALESGADDAFDATFAPSQIAARAASAVHRTARIPRDAEHIEVDGCTLDLDAGTARRGEKIESLTKREIDLISWLFRHRGRIVSRAELLEHVWRVSPRNATRAVDVAVAALRAKIERDARAPAIIVSIKGAGYRFTG